MPSVPLPPTRPSALAGAPAAHATGEAFGSEIPPSTTPAVGMALQGLGANIQQFGGAVAEYFAAKQGEKDAQDVSNEAAIRSYVPQYNKNLLEQTDPAHKGFTQLTIDDGQKWVEQNVKEAAAKGLSQKALGALRIRLNAELGQHVRNAAQQEVKSASDNAILDTNKGLQQRLDDIRTGGMISKENFQLSIDAAHKQLDDNPDLLPEQKKEAKIKYDQQAVAARFDAALEAANKSGDAKAAAAVLEEAKDPFWSRLFDQSVLDNRLKQIAQTNARWGELLANNTADKYINNVRADPDSYLKNAAEGAAELNKDTKLEGPDKTQAIVNFRSNIAAMRFESLGEKASTVEEIDDLLKEVKSEKFQDEFTGQGLTNAINSLLVRRNALESDQNSVKNKAAKLANEIQTREEQKLNVMISNMMEQTKAGSEIPDAQLASFMEFYHKTEASNLVLGNLGLNPETANNAKEIMLRQVQVKLTNKSSTAAVDAAVAGLRSNTDHKWTQDKDGRLTYTAPSGIKIRAAIYDHTSLVGLQPRIYGALDAMAAHAAERGITEIIITAGKGGGHKSHGDGTEVDVRMKKADGSYWTADDRVFMARVAGTVGMNRFGLYENSQWNSMHMGYAHKGSNGQTYSPAVWGAGGLTGGDASRNFRDGASRAFVEDFAGGKTGGNRAIAINDGSGGAGGSIEGGMPQWKRVIGLMETRGQGTDAQRYKVIVNESNGGDAALGMYGILLKNVGPWAKDAGLGDVTPSQFLNSPEIQDKIFEHRFAIYVRKYGPEGAAAAWFAGEEGMKNANASDGNQTVAGYIKQFRELMGGDAGSYDSSPGDAKGEAYTNDGFIQLDQLRIQRGVIDTQMSGGNFINYAAQVAGQPVPTLDTAEGWGARAALFEQGRLALTPTADQATFFTGGEANQFAKLVSDPGGNRAEQMAFFASVATLGSATQEAIYKQIGAKNEFAMAAARVYGEGRRDLALSGLNGNDTLKQLTAGAKPAWQEGFNQDFVEGPIGSTLRGRLDPVLTARNVGIKDLIQAVYADRYGVDQPYDPVKGQTVAEDVLQGHFDVVNGTRTLVPKDTTGAQFEDAQTAINWTKVSITNTPPGGRDPRQGGKLTEPDPWVLATAHPIRWAVDKYAFLDKEGNFLVTELSNGQVVRYIAALDTDTIKKSAEQAQAAGLGRATQETLKDVAPGEGSPLGTLDVPATTPESSITVQGRATISTSMGGDFTVEHDFEAQAPGTPAPAAPAISSTVMEESIKNYRESLVRNGTMKPSEIEDAVDEFQRLLRSKNK